MGHNESLKVMLNERNYAKWEKPYEMSQIKCIIYIIVNKNNKEQETCVQPLEARTAPPCALSFVHRDSQTFH